MAVSDDLKTIAEKHPVTPFNAKAMTLFPERINGKATVLFSAHTDGGVAKMTIAQAKNISDFWSPKFWDTWHAKIDTHEIKNIRRDNYDHVEVGAPPLKTKKGWLVIYSHIQNYFPGTNRRPLFGIEALLLDLKDPRKIIGRTSVPLLTPEEYYEKIGLVPNIIFPSGAILEKDIITLYYGAADTVCCVATINTKELLKKLLKSDDRIMCVRAKENPIIIPRQENAWESRSTFNPAAIYLEKKVHIVYRAMSEDNTSVCGYASSKDGVHIDYRSPSPIYSPRESFEQKRVPGGNSGCEDPRLTKIGDKIYMLYTAFDGINPPKVALTSILESDFLSKKWNWTKPIIISPHDFDDKDAVLFPEKYKGNYIIIHRIGDDIDFALVPNLDFKITKELEESRWITPRPGWWDSRKVGAAAPPLKTKEGWILLYHGVSHDSIYRVGAVLLDLKNPKKIIGRTDHPIFEPETVYEKNGDVSNVVFPCGAVLIKNDIFIYYGGGDKVTGVATIKLKEIMRMLKTSSN